MSMTVKSIARVCAITMVLSTSSWALTIREAENVLSGRWEHTARERGDKHYSILGYAKTDVIVFEGGSLDIQKTSYHVAPDGICLVGNHRRDSEGNYSFTLSVIDQTTFRLDYKDARGGKNWAVIKVGTNAFGHSVIAVRWRGARTVDYYRKA